VSTSIAPLTILQTEEQSVYGAADARSKKQGAHFYTPSAQRKKKKQKNALVSARQGSTENDKIVKLQFSYSTATEKSKKITVEQVRRTLCYTAAVDTSGSMSGSRMTSALSGLDVIVQMMRPTDLFGLVTFNSDVKNLHFPMERRRVDWEKDKGHVRNNLGGRTALWDAITAGVNLLKGVYDRQKQHPNRLNQQPMLFEQLVITDGMDNSSKTSFNDVKALVNKPGVPDYHLVLIVVTSDMESREVQRLAELTASPHTRMIEVKDVKSLKKTLEHEAERLRLVVESTDRTGRSTSGFKGTMKTVTEVKNNHFKAGLGGLVPKGLMSQLRGLSLEPSSV